jgi:hypothetical protein
MNIRQVTLPDGSIGIEMDDGTKPDGYVEDLDTLNVEDSEIPQELIDECEELSLKNDDIYFIFDSNTSSTIKSRLSSTKSEKRDNLIDSIIDVDTYYIGTDVDFISLPSRFSYYDTETKLVGRYKRYQFVVDFFLKLGFTPSESNFGPEFEQSFIFEMYEGSLFKQKIVVRIQPNLFIKMSIQDFDSLNNVYIGFFSKGGIYKSLSEYSHELYTSILRDAKLEDILS